MLGGDTVGLREHLVLVGAKDDLAVIAPGDPGDVGGAQQGEAVKKLPLLTYLLCCSAS